MGGSDTGRLLRIMARLRDPQQGCPWDLQQSHASLIPWLIEEAHEVVDAIERDDAAGLCDELGDLLLQVVFHARIAEEAGRFGYGDVVEAVCDKMERRHPHVFGAAQMTDAASQSAEWERIKAAERAAGDPQAAASAIDGVARALPALMRAVKLTRRAARVGFDWDSAAGVLAKIDEELAELANAHADREALAEEYGDLLFAVANLGRHLALDPEAALRAATAKFERRFRAMETALRETGLDIAEATPAQREAAWEQVKQRERAAAPPN
jgi:nucleoside triphosphate diphosphatase